MCGVVPKLKRLLLLAFLLPSCTLANSLSSVQDTSAPGLPTSTPTLEAGGGSQIVAPTLSVKPSPTPPRPSAARSLTPSAQKTLVPVSVPPLTLLVKSPLDESIVSASTITVIGSTSPNAVVSVDGQLATVDAAGNFQLAVTLDEGPNIIEVVASDINGNELSAILSIIYQP